MTRRHRSISPNPEMTTNQKGVVIFGHDVRVLGKNFRIRVSASFSPNRTHQDDTNQTTQHRGPKPRTRCQTTLMATYQQDSAVTKNRLLTFVSAFVLTTLIGVSTPIEVHANPVAAVTRSLSSAARSSSAPMRVGPHASTHWRTQVIPRAYRSHGLDEALIGSRPSSSTATPFSSRPTLDLMQQYRNQILAGSLLAHQADPTQQGAFEFVAEETWEGARRTAEITLRQQGAPIADADVVVARAMQRVSRYAYNFDRATVQTFVNVVTRSEAKSYAETLRARAARDETIAQAAADEYGTVATTQERSDSEVQQCFEQAAIAASYESFSIPYKFSNGIATQVINSPDIDFGEYRKVRARAAQMILSTSARDFAKAESLSPTTGSRYRSLFRSLIDEHCLD